MILGLKLSPAFQALSPRFRSQVLLFQSTALSALGLHWVFNRLSQQPPSKHCYFYFFCFFCSFCYCSLHYFLHSFSPDFWHQTASSGLSQDEHFEGSDNLLFMKVSFMTEQLFLSGFALKRAMDLRPTTLNLSHRHSFNLLKLFQVPSRPQLSLTQRVLAQRLQPTLLHPFGLVLWVYQEQFLSST